MARIRTIKPEFPQSESMGRVSRDARLTFILLWTIADDTGRLRGNSRMLASLLYPYDEDARALIDAWLMELEGETCIERYEAEGNSYIQVNGWASHQKIDRPSQSKYPAPPTLANPRESSRALDESHRWIKDQGRDQGREGSGEGAPAPSAPAYTAPAAPIPTPAPTPEPTPAPTAAPTPAPSPAPTPTQKKRAKSLLVPLPPDFAISDRVRKWASANGHTRLDEHFESFCNSARARAYVYQDWDAAFMEAIRKDWAQLRPRGQGSARRSGFDELGGIGQGGVI